MRQNPLPENFLSKLLALIPFAVVIIFSACTTHPQNSNAATIHSNQSQSAAADTNWRLNINTASEKELEKLPGIGDVLAERIVSYRNQHGPFSRIEHLMMVRGISENKFNDIKRFITVE
jgi:comEA protein